MIKMTTRIVLGFTILLPLFLVLHEKYATASTEFVYAGCSPAKYDANTPYQANLNALLAAFVSAAPGASYDGLAVGNSSSSAPGTAAYGLYQCRDDLGLPDCASCVRSAVSQLSIVCANSFAASLQLEDCFVRYGNEDFIGKMDTSVVYNKCSHSRGDGDGEFFRRRDDVMAELQASASAAAGSRVSNSGAVQGYSQCVGDLGSSDCATCLAQAVAQLKNACGSAMAADVYLAKCYARFWAAGYYQRSAPDYSDDDIGKTVAIIVGTLAGVAFFVVFLSFIKRAC